MENDRSEFRIIKNTKNCKSIQTSLHKNNEIENMIFSAAKLNKNSEVKVYFKNIPADEYTLGYKKFCGIKINDFVFYNPSLFDLYPKFINFIYSEQMIDLNKIISKINLSDAYFSNNKLDFRKSKPIINSNIHMNLDISFDEMIYLLDRITQYIYRKKVLKILTVCYIKN